VPKLQLRVFFWLITGWLVLAATLALYCVRLRSSAQDLIDAAGGITSSSDIQQLVDNLRSRTGVVFWKNGAQSNGEETYEFRIENTLLHRLHLLPPAMLGVTIAIQGGKLHSLSVVMFSGRQPSTTSGVWIQEWFGDSTREFRVNDNRRPSKATVDFTSGMSGVLKKKAFQLNANCLVKLRGCRSAEEILPGVWNLRESADAPEADYR
jgi:hypothetical protein